MLYTESLSPFGSLLLLFVYQIHRHLPAPACLCARPAYLRTPENKTLSRNQDMPINPPDAVSKKWGGLGEIVSLGLSGVVIYTPQVSASATMKRGMIDHDLP